jgi:hypothetical protein
MCSLSTSWLILTAAVAVERLVGHWHTFSTSSTRQFLTLRSAQSSPSSLTIGVPSWQILTSVALLHLVGRRAPIAKATTDQREGDRYHPVVYSRISGSVTDTSRGHCEGCPSSRYDHVHFQLHELGSDLAKAVAPPLSPTNLDCEIAPLGPTEFAEPLHTYCELRVPICRRGRA